MKNPIRFRLAALCVAALLSGCGSVTSNIAFKAPSGWSGTPSIFGRMQMWIKKDSDQKKQQFVMLIRGDVSSQNMFRTAQTGRGSITVSKRSTITICGGRQAQYVTGVQKNNDGRKTAMEAIIADVGDSKYMALYAREAGTPEDPQAEAAIHSLCPK